MFVKNNIAKPGEIKAVFLDPKQVEVKLRSGEVLRYERKTPTEIKDLPELREEKILFRPREIRTVPALRSQQNITTRERAEQ